MKSSPCWVPAAWAKSTRPATPASIGWSPSKSFRSPSGDPEFRQRFDREARTISQLDHPDICALYDVGEHDGVSYLVMQYLEGDTLDARLRKGALPLDQALQVRDSDRRRARASAPRRHRAPRPEARQHHADEDRREAARLRAGEVGRGRRQRDGRDVAGLAVADREGHHPRYMPVHGARAAGRPRGRRSNGRLRARKRHLRDGDGHEGVQRDDARKPCVGHPEGSAAGDPESSAAGASAFRSHRRAMPGEGSRRALAGREGPDA